MAETAAEVIHEPSAKEIRLVIGASSAGTIFEWYDFFIYGTLFALIGQAFFPSDNETLQILLVWAGFAIGFGFRPLGAILFGYLGDKLGRKYTFLVTVTLMGIATAGVGLVPSAESIGLWAPAIVIVLRILQGLALGGEYGGAAIYVAEHAPPEKRGFYTSFIQASVVGGFVLSIVVVLVCRALIPEEQFADWGWRVPFLLSVVLLGISLWMRLKLNESPVFRAMKAEGNMSGNPFVESFTYPGNRKRILIAFGVSGILTTIWYSAFFSSLSFLQRDMRLEESIVETVLLIAGFLSMGFYVLVGKWSDKVGRKKPIMIGALLTLILIFPLFWGLGKLANPNLSEAAAANPVVVSGPECTTDPFADLFDREQTACGSILEALTSSGVRYERVPAETLSLSVGGEEITIVDEWLEDSTARRNGIQSALTERGFDFSRQSPPMINLIGILGILLVTAFLSALTYGSVAALLTEMFPPKIRYSSMSIPYHFGAGFLGGFLPLISGFIVARTGDIFAGLWYTWVVVAIGAVIAGWGLKGGPPEDFKDDPV
ncbi:MFS transporter [Aurantiacibacter marinus]|uniref:Major facilitator transporter n=1 Tax=Aurantiacibacter marinus TaxID=874156 RepID=A0A0H0XPM8_9SPHN|nr:MFS transporter [Aurantiacibacter marinus]KLI63872.1 major facilitator transporter [Aurantiacibacter marinus]